MDQATVQRLIAEECDALFERIIQQDYQWLLVYSCVDIRNTITTYSKASATPPDVLEFTVAWQMVNSLIKRHQPEPPISDGSLHRRAEAMRQLCAEIREMLLAKNRAYGSSALDPVRVFSRASAEEQILVRLDDKLSRLARGHAAGEDTARDAIGYLVLLRVSRRLQEVR